MLIGDHVAAVVAQRLVRTATALLALVAAGCGGSGGPGGPTTPPTPGPAGTVGVQVRNEGWGHVLEGSAITYASNPPASGPHYPVWARYQAYTTALDRGYWVHNLEHGAIVMLYRPDTPAAVVSALADAYRSLPVDPQCGHTRALLTPDPLLPRPMIAVIAADWLLTTDGVDGTSIRDFTLAHRGRGPENICQGGTRP
jgi:hypothetical protein